MVSGPGVASLAAFYFFFELPLGRIHLASSYSPGRALSIPFLEGCSGGYVNSAQKPVTALF